MEKTSSAGPARLRLDMAPPTWEDHEMQCMAGGGKRRSVGRGRRSSAPVLPLAGFLFLISTSTETAQTDTPSRTVWDGVYKEAQAARGMMAYSQSCAGCHALAAEGKAPLVGEPFWKSFSQKTVGDLLELVSTYMPNGAPGSLGAPSYRD